VSFISKHGVSQRISGRSVGSGHGAAAAWQSQPRTSVAPKYSEGSGCDPDRPTQPGTVSDLAAQVVRDHNNLQLLVSQRRSTGSDPSCTID